MLYVKFFFPAENLANALSFLEVRSTKFETSGYMKDSVFSVVLLCSLSFEIILLSLHDITIGIYDLQFFIYVLSDIS